MWTFAEAEAYLADTAPPGKSIYGLGRIKHLLDLVGHPERDFPCVTVVGTNGKGSVLSFMESIIRSHELRVACHIKPHLESVTERIRLDGIDSTPHEFASALWDVKTAVDAGWARDDRPTYFELIFAAFMCAVKECGIDIALLETGLGGRLDAVNAVDAPLVVMTSIGLDHTELLGDTLELITKEKLMIVRSEAILLLQDNPEAVLDTARKYAWENRVRLIEMGKGSEIHAEFGIGGPFQPGNAALAVEAVRILADDIYPEFFPNGIDERLIEKGLMDARLPGRWELIKPGPGFPDCIIDGAHNSQALWRVIDEFRMKSAGEGTIIFGMKKTKDFKSVIPWLSNAASNVIFVPVPDTEFVEPAEMAEILRGTLDNQPDFSQIHIDIADSIMEGLRKAFLKAPGTGTILVTGSLYLVGAARTILRSGTLIPGECYGV